MAGKRESKISRRAFVKAATAGALLLDNLPVGKAAQKETGLPAPILHAKLPQSMRRPNVIFILADDLGWGDLSCYGRPDYRTPNLDRLALEGTRFTNAYSASCVCTPTRCAFHTGRYPARLPIGLEEPLIGNNNRVGLDSRHPTISSLLQKNGYATALVGKWHLGFRPEWAPNAHGFEEFFGILAGASDYFLHRTGMGKRDLYENLTLVERKGYM
ncbi:MAG: sulfatase-like hydrolase/transferase, partial [Pyrinomonadaceae bacterium]